MSALARQVGMSAPAVTERVQRLKRAGVIRATGEDCFLIKVHAPSVQQLEDVLDRFLVYGQTVTSIVVSTPVPARDLPLDSGRR
jgi:Lrp/AsnC family transcriptional regulator, leucine-responsive regulatory protein